MVRRVRRLLPIAVLAVLALSGAAPADGTFLSVISDLPLMDGLTEQPGSAMVFSKPEGRIVEVAAAGPPKRAAVAAFYRRTLPQLGWRQTGAETYEREGERLTLTFEENREGIVVQFSLTPR